MFARRKKQDGFEWQQYVRTTIKLRREQRHLRMVEARRAAADQVGAAGSALVAGSKAAGAAARHGARAGLGALGLGVQRLWQLTVALGGAAAREVAVWARPVAAALARPNIGGPIALAGAIALGSGIGRYRGAGLDTEALLTLGIGVALLLAVLPMLGGMTGLRLPRLSALGITPRIGLVAIAAGAVVAGVAWLASGGTTNLAGIASQLPLVGGSKPLEGRAQAVGGDRVRVGATTVRLAGIEAPERQQRCGEGKRAWRCAASAEAALARLVNGRNVSCALGGSDDAGQALATCTRGTLEINAELVRQGHVFAASGMFAAYASHERDARAAKAGIWSGGEIARPAEFRAKAWEEAKRRAPDGCPIKGVVQGASKVYLLPWSPEYERGRIQKARGERWFCSEQEAAAAGWKPARG
jgi:endonuclease YncB( thermonuclease family)